MPLHFETEGIQIIEQTETPFHVFEADAAGRCIAVHQKFRRGGIAARRERSVTVAEESAFGKTSFVGGQRHIRGQMMFQLVAQLKHVGDVFQLLIGELLFGLEFPVDDATHVVTTIGNALYVLGVGKGKSHLEAEMAAAKEALSKLAVK